MVINLILEISYQNTQFLRYELFYDRGTFSILLNTCVGTTCKHILYIGYVDNDESLESGNFCLYQPLVYI